jgi:circadian clock protein KaiC
MSAISKALSKTRTGIEGLDVLTGGGLPKGRPTLICGGTGCGKTLFALEFAVNGAMHFNEPAIFVSFEESPKDLTENVASLGFDLDDLIKKKKLAIEHIVVERHLIEETGRYDLSGLFVRLQFAVKSIGAKRVVLDTIENLFSGLKDLGILRAELLRLFLWLKENNLTAVVTAEKGEGQLTRHGLEEYISDCVIFLDHRVIEQISTRRLRIVKYRGTSHGTNEYPFLIHKDGISVIPITSLGLDYKASSERVSSGIVHLDQMLSGGYFKGTSVLVTGTAGTGKSSIAAMFAIDICKKGQKCIYFAFEESESQVIRNMRSIGLDLTPFIKKGLLKFHAMRPSIHGLEMHLALMHELIKDFGPAALVIDPISNLIAVGGAVDVKAMVVRLVDYIKCEQVTSLFTHLTGPENIEETDIGLSSLMDTWILVRNIETQGVRNRALYILKSRGTAHSNEIKELKISNTGLELSEIRR